MRSILILTAGFLLLMNLQAISQVKNKKKETISSSIKSLSLDLEKTNITFDFIWFDDYVNGLGKHKGKYYTKGRISSNTNWKLTCNANGNFTRNGSAQKKMSLNNVGYTLEHEGNSNTINRIKTKTKKLGHKPTTLLQCVNNGRGNDDDGDEDEDEDDDDEKKKKKKDKSKNKNSKNEQEVDHFTIYWEMGTRNGSMNKKSLIKQNLPKGEYSVQINLVLIEKL